MGVYIFISVLVLIACFLQILVVLVQNSKGGGLSANFTSTGQSMGIRKTADFLEKSTWTLAGTIAVLCLVATATIPRGATSGQSRMKIRFIMLLIRALFRLYRQRFRLILQIRWKQSRNRKINFLKKISQLSAGSFAV